MVSVGEHWQPHICFALSWKAKKTKKHTKCGLLKDMKTKILFGFWLHAPEPVGIGQVTFPTGAGQETLISENTFPLYSCSIANHTG